MAPRPQTLLPSPRAPVDWLGEAVRTPGREREALVQSLKVAVAAVAAWYAGRAVSEEQAFIAPFAAVFLIAETPVRSLLGVARQLSALFLGIALAFAALQLVGDPYVAMGLAVLAGMLIGQWRAFGDSGFWIGVTALLMLGYGTADDLGALGTRIGVTALGAAIGAAINILVLPPVHLRVTSQAVRDAAGEVGRFVRSIADGLRASPTADDARSWLQEARALELSVRRAEDAATRAREGTRLNPRYAFRARRRAEIGPWRHETAIGALHETAEQAKRISEALAWFHGEDDTSIELEPRFEAGAPDLLERLAEVVEGYESFPGLDGGEHADDLERLLDDMHREHRELRERTRDPDVAATGALSVETSMLLAIERAARSLRDDCAAAHPATSEDERLQAVARSARGDDEG